MLYMIDKNMKIYKNLKLLENADDYDISNDEKKKKRRKMKIIILLIIFQMMILIQY